LYRVEDLSRLEPGCSNPVTASAKGGRLKLTVVRRNRAGHMERQRFEIAGANWDSEGA
jgi:hypothetical protein